MDTYKQNCKKNYLKFIIGFIVCILIRLIPFRPPSIEPILATQMPFAKAYGRVTGFFFGFFSIVFYDIITHTLGIWTLVTASTYGVLGLWANYFFQKRKASTFNFVIFAIFGTLFFDVITGLSIGPLFFNQSFMEALVGQIPFTGLHLLGNISFAVVLSPALYRFVVENKRLETTPIINIFNSKRI